MTRPVVALISFRLGGPDGVSVVASSWAATLSRLGWDVRTVAGAGPVDVVVPGLDYDHDAESGLAPDAHALAAALAPADLVIVENLCSLPLHPAATEAVAAARFGRPTVLHHHDLPWQRERFEHIQGWPPTDPAWRHVTINELSRQQLLERGVESTLIRNAFDTDPLPGDRDGTRAALGVDPSQRLLVHPVRAIERKGIPDALAFAADVDAAYWLLGPAEEGYGAVLETLVAGSPVPVIRGLHGATVADAYAASDAVLFPSTWEGFGNPIVESAAHRRPLVIRRYPVAREVEPLGFQWFDIDEPGVVAELRRFWDEPSGALLDQNHAVARRWFSHDSLRLALTDVLAGMGWHQ